MTAALGRFVGLQVWHVGWGSSRRLGQEIVFRGHTTRGTASM